MARWSIHPTRFDRAVAKATARHTSRVVEQSAKVITLLADERVLLMIAGTCLFISRAGSTRQRRLANHFNTSVVATVLLAHLMKGVIAQERPDRAVVQRTRRGIPRSGKAYDAFPSGHAMHLGAVAAALARFYPSAAPSIWFISGMLGLTRIILLAHWTTDVVAGYAAGVVVEQALWTASQYFSSLRIRWNLGTARYVDREEDQDGP